TPCRRLPRAGRQARAGDGAGAGLGGPAAGRDPVSGADGAAPGASPRVDGGAPKPATSASTAPTAFSTGTRSTGSAPINDPVRTWAAVADLTTGPTGPSGPTGPGRAASAGFQSTVAAGLAPVGASADSSIDPAALTGNSQCMSQPLPHAS